MNGTDGIALVLIASGISDAITMPVQVKFSNQDQNRNVKAGHCETWPTTAFADPFLMIVTIPRRIAAMKMLTEFIQDSFLTGGDLVDTKFYAFTRLSGHTADTPRPIYANSKFLLGWANEYLTDCKLQNEL